MQCKPEHTGRAKQRVATILLKICIATGYGGSKDDASATFLAAQRNAAIRQNYNDARLAAVVKSIHNALREVTLGTQGQLTPFKA